MAENETKQNPDWNQNGQPQADRDVRQQPGNRDEAGQPRRDVEHGAGGPAEGRDGPPPHGDRDKNEPWLGGG